MGIAGAEGKEDKKPLRISPEKCEVLSIGYPIKKDPAMSGSKFSPDGSERGGCPENKMGPGDERK